MQPFTLRAILIASTVILFLGYDQGIISGAILFMRDDLDFSEVQTEIAIGVLNIAAAFGGLLPR